jgi:hypothetical protein
MINSNKIIEEIIKQSNVSISSLEKQYDKIKKELETKKVVELSLKDLRNLLAFEYLKDGAELSFIEEITKFKEPKYQNKIDLLKELSIFGY